MQSAASAARRTLAYAAAGLLLAACAAGGGQQLTLDTRQVPAVEYLPEEVTAMLRDLGYLVVSETETERLAQTFDDYHLQFKARDDDSVRLDVHFGLTEKITRMHLYRADERRAGAATERRFAILKERVQQEFGAGNVD